MKYAGFILILLIAFARTKAQELQSYITEAEMNNPEVRAFNLRYNIARERVKEVNSLPNTVVSAGYFVSEPETRTGPQRARISVTQMLPWFGTITARENYAGSMAEAEFVEIVIVKRKLALAVAQSYYKLYAIKAKQEVLKDNISLLNTYKQLALTSVEVGNASAVDVLRLQIRQNELLEQKNIIQLEYLAEQASFNNLLNRKESLAVVTSGELKILSEDPGYSIDSLETHSELLKYDKLYQSVVQTELLNQKERAPNIGFGLDYIPVSERKDMNFDDNGKDILMPMVSVSIPIFSNKYGSISKQNELRQMEILTQKQQRLNVLKSTYATALARRSQARIKFNTQDNNLKQANDAEEILIKNYETGTINFNDILEIQELKLKFGLDRIEAIRMYYEQSAIINYLMN